MQNRKTLAALTGAGAAVLLLVLVPQFEGKRNVGYLDPAGIPTKCFGDTRGVIIGKRYGEAACLASLQTQLIAHAEGVLRCTPGLKGRDNQTAAAVSFAYNIGVGGYCTSSVARRFNAGDFKGGCAEMSKYVYAGGRVLPGLITRRAAERRLCEKGLS
jgi:lysozyme